MNRLRQAMRHSAAEVLALSLGKLFPTAKLVAAAAHEWGFYVDMAIDQPIDAAILPVIEENFRASLKSEQVIEKREMMRQNGVAFFEHRQQPIKAALIAMAESNVVSICQIGDFYDYNPEGEHVITVSEIRFVKLCTLDRHSRFIPTIGHLNVVRIEGTAFEEKQQLKHFLKKRLVALEGSHEKLMPQCRLFEKEEGKLLTTWLPLPRGALLGNLLKEWWHTLHRDQGFLFLSTPRLWNSHFLKKQKLDFEENFSCQIEDQEFVLASPSLCSYFHAYCFQAEERQERQLPIRYAELGERMHNYSEESRLGLLRSPIATYDVAHLFCSKKMFTEELISSLQFIIKIISMLALEWRCYLISGVVRRNVDWTASASEMKKALHALDLPYLEEDKGNGKLTGPRIEFRWCDGLDREWCGPSLEVNCSLTRQCQLHFRTLHGAREMAWMLKRTLFGSLEALMALLVEKFQGRLPFWLAPEQVRVFAVTEAQADYAAEIYQELMRSGVRTGLSPKQDSQRQRTSLSAEVHLAEQLFIPYLLIVGSREQKERLVTIRQSGRKNPGKTLSLEAFMQEIIPQLHWF